MDRVDKNCLAMTKPASFQEMRNSRALRDIRNFVAAPSNPRCVAGKRGLAEFLSSSNKNFMDDTRATFMSKRSITRKFAASLAKTSQPYHQETGGGYMLGGSDRQKQPFPTILSSNSLDACIAIDVDDYKLANELPLPMVEETEEMGNSDPKEVEMEDLEVETVPDIDRCDSEDPLAVVDYVEDIYNFYGQIEIIGCVNPNYMSNQFDINEKMRAILIDWLIEVHHKFELMDETLFLTVNIIDRFLEKQTVIRKKLQLVGVTAMLLACKYEEVSVPVVEDLILISDRAYTREDVLQMERLMISTLQFDLSVPTPYVFMRRFLKAAQSDKQLELVSFFIIELCLVEYQMLKFRPSLLAAAAVFTAQCALNRFKHWTRTIKLHTSYSDDQLLECSRFMVDFHQKAGTGNLTGVYRKYSSFKFGYAAKSEPAFFLLDMRA